MDISISFAAICVFLISELLVVFGTGELGCADAIRLRSELVSLSCLVRSRELDLEALASKLDLRELLLSAVRSL